MAVLFLAKRALDEESREDESMDVGGKAASPHTGETILVVDDDPAILKVTTRVLEARGYVVLRAGLPSEALRIADGTRFDLLLSDVMMPEMNGPALAKLLAARHPPFEVLFMSGYSAEIIGPEGALDGRAAFLDKPFTGSQLATKVREVLGVRRTDAA